MVRFTRGIAALLIVAAAGCSSAGEQGTSISAAPTAQLVRSDLPRETVDLLASENALDQARLQGASVAGFGTALLSQLPTDGNLVISPYSIYAVLAMARAGGTGPVVAELDSVLQSNDPGAAVTAVDTALQLAAERGHNSQDNSDEVVINPANSLWVQSGAIQQSFLDRLATEFGAGAYLTDYAADPEASRLEINGWVSERTKALIPQLIPAGALTPETVLTMVNALYFQATWQVVFEPDPAPLTFHRAAGDVDVPAFSRTDHLGSTTGDGWRSVTVPYTGSGVAMTFIVPDAGRFADVAASLDAVAVGAATAPVDGPKVHLTVPKFSIDYATSVRPALESLGATVFFGDADWSAISTDRGLSVSDVLHQAVIAVDENGTVAAAATAEILAGAAAPQPEQIIELALDRPFLFVIHDVLTGAPLFLGRVLDPST